MKWAKERSIFNPFDCADDVLWDDGEQDVMVASSVKNFKVPIVKMGTLLTVNMDTVTPISEGRCNLTHFMYCMKLIQKHFFSEDYLFEGLPWIQRNLSFSGRCDLFGSLSCILDLVSQIKRRYKINLKMKVSVLETSLQ